VNSPIEAESTLLSCAGTETYLQFVQQFPLRDFCAFELFEDPAALAEFERGFLAPIAAAAAHGGHALLVDALAWRAHPDYVERLGYGPADLERLNRKAVECARAFARRARQAALSRGTSPGAIYIGGDLGPRGDGYQLSGEPMTEAAAARYHRQQLTVLAEAGVDVVNALTMTSVAETVGIVRAATGLGLPVIVSPTIETDGTTPDGLALGEFIERVEEATGDAPLYYMVNCAHPTHLEPTLRAGRDAGAAWLHRFRGFRANASALSHEELDNCDTLDRGDPQALARAMAQLARDYDLSLLGGCCGTDAEHIAALAAELRTADADAGRLGA